MENDKEQEIYRIYKPLKNQLGKLSIEESLYVIWAYMRHFQFGKRINPDIEIPKFFMLAPDRPAKGFFEWELELLCREVIINSWYLGSNEKTIRQWSQFAGVINKIKTIENELAGIYSTPENIEVEMTRLAYREFPWQFPPDSCYLIRYYKIFDTPEIRSLVFAKLGIPLEEIYGICAALIGFYLKTPAAKIPISSNIKNISTESAQRFLGLFSLDFESMKQKMTIERVFNDEFAYTFSSLRQFPIIQMMYQKQINAVCPIPTFLYWRITSGLYYEICQEPTFGNSFGASFQNYIGEIMQKCLNPNNFSVIPEEPYGKSKKDTIDWIIDQSTSALFIECKTKRVSHQAKFSLKDSSFMDIELRKMAGFIVQVYKTINDYKKGLYPSLKYDPNKKIFPMVLTLEDWYIFAKEAHGKIETYTLEGLKNEGLDESFLKDMPISICSVREFEEACQIIDKVGVEGFMTKKVANDYTRRLKFDPYMRDEFMDIFKTNIELFADDYRRLFEKFKD